MKIIRETTAQCWLNSWQNSYSSRETQRVSCIPVRAIQKGCGWQSADPPDKSSTKASHSTHSIPVVVKLVLM